MIFGAQTRLESAPGNEELAVLERSRPLVSGVPGLSDGARAPRGQRPGASVNEGCDRRPRL